MKSFEIGQTVIKKSLKPFKSGKIAEVIKDFGVNELDPKKRECAIFEDGSNCNLDRLEHPIERKLIKISSYKYILVDDSKRGQAGLNYNYALRKLENLSRSYPEHSSEWNFCRKVTHSTSLIDVVGKIEPEMLEIFLYNNSIQNIASNIFSNTTDKNLREAYLKGFKKCENILDNRMFTIEDLERAIKMARETKPHMYNEEGEKPVFLGDYPKFSPTQIINSFVKDKTEWNVFVNRKGKIILNKNI